MKKRKAAANWSNYNGSKDSTWQQILSGKYPGAPLLNNQKNTSGATTPDASAYGLIAVYDGTSSWARRYSFDTTAKTITAIGSATNMGLTWQAPNAGAGVIFDNGVAAVATHGAGNNPGTCVNIKSDGTGVTQVSTALTSGAMSASGSLDVIDSSRAIWRNAVVQTATLEYRLISYGANGVSSNLHTYSYTAPGTVDIGDYYGLQAALTVSAYTTSRVFSAHYPAGTRRAASYGPVTANLVIINCSTNTLSFVTESQLATDIMYGPYISQCLDPFGSTSNRYLMSWITTSYVEKMVMVKVTDTAITIGTPVTVYSSTSSTYRFSDSPPVWMTPGSCLLLLQRSTALLPISYNASNTSDLTFTLGTAKTVDVSALTGGGTMGIARISPTQVLLTGYTNISSAYNGYAKLVIL